MSEDIGTVVPGKLESAQQALDELRKQFFGICNRLERAGLNTGMIVTIGELYEAAEKERLRKSFVDSTGQPIARVFGEALSASGLGSVSPDTGAKERDRVRDAILSGSSDPASPAKTSGPSNFVHSGGAIRARIEEGLVGL